MRFRRPIAALLSAAALAATLAVPASAAEPPSNVAEVLGADGVAFDSNWYDFDIVEKAALTVIDAKSGDTAVALLADDDAVLTVLAPNDRAFQVLVASLTGRWYWNEATVFAKLVEAVKGLNGGDMAKTVDTIENVLLYHVIPGAALTRSQVVAASGASVATALDGASIRIRYVGWLDTITLGDLDYDAADPWVVNRKTNIAAGKSIIHGISLVLRPIDLPRAW
jgi:uncharacterized surface protein with fasciclin (FAS1) repeats